MASGNASYKNPPILDISDYETWRNEIEMWILMTEVKAEKQALAVALSLKGQARATALEIEAKKLNENTGMKVLLDALDAVYKKDEIDLAYTVYSNFENFRRSEGQSMVEYIVVFERLYQLCKRHKMELPDTILSFKLLDNAGLTGKDRQLALTAASNLEWASMKSALKRIFGESKTGCNAESGIGIAIKQESVLFTSGKANYYSRFNNVKTRNETQKGTNPINKYGKRSRCAICGCTYHWAKDCEHRKNEEVKMTTSEDCEQDCNIAMDSNTTDCSSIVFMTEAYGVAVIDTACTRTVCGAKWIEDYVSTLNEQEKEEIIESTCNRTYRFGDGAKVISEKNLTFPAFIGDHKCTISSDVVNIDLPLLLSKQSLKDANAIIDLTKDKATFFGKTIDLEQTSSGHYCVDLKRCTTSETDSTNQVLLVIEAKDEQEKEKKMKKLHRQFGHATKDRLKKLLIDAGVNDSDLFRTLEKVVNNCEICDRHSKTPSRPVVSLPMASDFNEVVSMDLHHLEGTTWILHLIDMFTRYSSGAIIESKEGQIIVDRFIKHWIGIFGAPKKMFSDNGGEFENEQMKQLGHTFGIEILTTAAYSPWSNGLCERHNLTLSETVKKVKEDRNCSWEVALHWALMAKNSLSSVHGYSAHQLVFGRNPNLPSVIDDALPALEGSTTSVTVGQHVSAMYTARRAFIEAECSDRIRRALRRQTRTSTNEIYQMGEKVYYKRPSKNEWRGPGKVIGQDGVVVFLRHGGQLVRAHVCRLKKVIEEAQTKQKNSRDEIEQRSNEETELSLSYTSDDDTQDIRDEISQQETETEATPDLQTETEVPSVQRTSEENQVEPRTRNDSYMKLKPGQHITFRMAEGEEKQFGTVLSRAGKSTGKYRNWYNVGCENDSGELNTLSLNTDAVKDLEVINLPQRTEEDVLLVENETFEKAKVAEMESWKQHGVYEMVKDTGQKAISTRWICSMKEKEGKLVPKARLVARGFEEYDNSDIQKESPTCSSEALKVILSVIAQKNWEPRTMDIKTAFLQGNSIDREVYLKPPKEANNRGNLWLLKKCVYGLSDASLHWYKRVKTVMQELGAKVSKVDPAVFIWNKDGQLNGILACHVDDFLWAGDSHDSTFEKNVMERVRKEFLVGREEEVSFSYVGLEVNKKGSIITLDQKRYAENINPMEITRSRAMQKDSQITEEEQSEMRSKIGQLLWTARQTRPDVMFEASTLSGRIKTGQVKDLIEMNKVIKRVKTEKLTLKFQPLQGDLQIIIYTDASLGNLKDGGSQGAQMACLYGEEGMINPLWWSSKKIRRVARSTIAAETMALADGIDMGIFLATLYAEITKGEANPKLIPLTCRVDCKSLYEAVYSTKDLTEKRLRLDLAGIKEQLVIGQIRKIEWIKTGEQLVDSLTKKGASCLKLMKALETGRIDD
jgi:transposase InsO family protein